MHVLRQAVAGLQPVMVMSAPVQLTLMFPSDPSQGSLTRMRHMNTTQTCTALVHDVQLPQMLCLGM